MKKIITLFEIKFNQMSKSIAFTNYTQWIMAFMLLFAAISCKKVTEVQGIVGLCPVVTTDPMNNAVDVSLNKIVGITFNTEMNPVTINGTTFTIKNGSQIIPGTVVPTANAAVFNFTPDVALSPFVKYTGTVTNQVIDKFRTAMVSDYIWTFTTIPQIKLSANPIAGGTVTGAGNFAQSSNVTVVATPRIGYTFTNWADSGSAVVVSTSPSYQYAMAGNRTLVANFSLISATQFAVVTSSLPTGGGATFGSGSYITGTVVTVVESPNPGYTFLNWTEGSTIVSSSSSYQFTINSNRILVANFTLVSPILLGTAANFGAFGGSAGVTNQGINTVINN